MRLVILESPYSGDVEKHEKYARECMIDCLKRNEAPFASHLLYTQVLHDHNTSERTLGINAGLEWAKKADVTVVYLDYGISVGMWFGIQNAWNNKREVEYRMLYGK